MPAATESTRPDGDDHLLTSQEVAEIFHVNPVSLYRWLWNRDGGPPKTLGRAMFSRADVAAYLASTPPEYALLAMADEA
jgi:hypothetical protein